MRGARGARGRAAAGTSLQRSRPQSSRDWRETDTHKRRDSEDPGASSRRLESNGRQAQIGRGSKAGLERSAAFLAGGVRKTRRYRKRAGEEERDEPSDVLLRLEILDVTEG